MYNKKVKWKGINQKKNVNYRLYEIDCTGILIMKIFKNKKRKCIIITSLASTFLIMGLANVYYSTIPKEESLIGFYIDGTYSKTLPAKGSGYAVEKITCDNNKNASWDYNKWGIKFLGWGTRSRCNIYFKNLESITLANRLFYLDEAQQCPALNSDGTVTVTGIEDTYGYLCKAKDAYGDSYYYRGNVTNNYVLFAGKYWRIIRYNGDGTVRVIYDGTVAHANGDASVDRRIGDDGFNSSYGDNAYVGYMYGKPGVSIYSETHTNTDDSRIKTNLDTWFENNIKSTIDEQYIADNIFCNDRSFARNNSGTGAGKSKTYYRWYNFADNINNNKMMLTCPQKNDAFTVNDISKGNGALTYGIGLITADEVILSGGWKSSNSGYYLYTGFGYWTMSPYHYINQGAAARVVASNGSAGDSGLVDTGGSNVYNDRGIRPVLNLSSEILKNGNGTASDPYHA